MSSYLLGLFFRVGLRAKLHHPHHREEEAHEYHAQHRVKERNPQHDDTVFFVRLGDEDYARVVADERSHEHRGHDADRRLGGVDDSVLVEVEGGRGSRAFREEGADEHRHRFSRKAEKPHGRTEYLCEYGHDSRYGEYLYEDVAEHHSGHYRVYRYVPAFSRSIKEGVYKVDFFFRSSFFAHNVTPPPWLSLFCCCRL